MLGPGLIRRAPGPHDDQLVVVVHSLPPFLGGCLLVLGAIVGMIMAVQLIHLVHASSGGGGYGVGGY
jgi:hypothetical protein